MQGASAASRYCNLVADRAAAHMREIVGAYTNYSFIYLYADGRRGIQYTFYLETL